MEPRILREGQATCVWVYDLVAESCLPVHVNTQLLLEAPNCVRDGSLILNGAGKLWSLSPQGLLTLIPLEGIPDINNDHVLDPDGEHIYLSANDWQIYRARLEGGSALRVTNGAEIPGLMHFLHGVSPDGKSLAFIGLEPEGANWWAHANVFTVSSSGKNYQRLTSGTTPFDGSEYSPDGEWLYVNTEVFDGHSQIARMRPDGSGIEQLTFDDNVNWFPHPSPDGEMATYISFPPGTQGHPENVWVDIKLVSIDDWESPETISHIFGGQGSLNVNSWNPNSLQFAFVSYPEESHE